MAHIPPLDTDSYPELQPILAGAAAMGFMPNSTRTMAHMRQLPIDFAQQHLVDGGWQLSKHVAE